MNTIKEIISPIMLLHNDIFISLAKKLSLSDLNKICLINKFFFEEICDNQNFWNIKFIYDFGQSNDITNLIDWKNKYKETLKIFGLNTVKKVIEYFNKNNIISNNLFWKKWEKLYPPHPELVFSGEALSKAYDYLSEEFDNIQKIMNNGEIIDNNIVYLLRNPPTRVYFLRDKYLEYYGNPAPGKNYLVLLTNDYLDTIIYKGELKIFDVLVDIYDESGFDKYDERRSIFIKPSTPLGITLRDFLETIYKEASPHINNMSNIAFESIELDEKGNYRISWRRGDMF